MRPSTYCLASPSRDRWLLRPSLRVLALATSLLISPSLLAQEIRIYAGPALLSTGNPYLDTLIVVAVCALIFALFYWFLYPRLLPHYGEAGSKGIFWTGFLLWTCTWLHFSAFTFFTYGFLFAWLQWTLLVLIALLALFFLLNILRT